MTSRPSTAAPTLAVLAIVLVTLGAYVGGYLWLGEYGEGMFPPNTRVIIRTYPLEWQKVAFGPAAKVERLLRCAVIIRSAADVAAGIGREP
jgi:hypothetical protein